MIEIGEKLSGRYKITGNIGNGGMAYVYLAHDLILDRDVAIKVLRFDFQEDQSAIRRFQREALAVTELVHPNIVNVYDVDEENGMQFIVMEYVKGPDRNLKEYIQNHSPIPLTKVIDIMDQILSAISMAHQQGIIHRDLKPQNILMDQRGTVKIADFGIAIALSETSITQTNTLLGSVHYLSPEQARGGMATRQSDIYALGIILYELLTGNVPFEGESAVSIALKHFQEELPSVRSLNPHVPQAMENVVLHATAKEAVDRYLTAGEMAADLSTVLSPNRIGEPPFEPHAMVDETKVIEPFHEETMKIAPEATVEQEIVEPPASQKEYPASKNKKASNRKKKVLMAGAAAFVLLGILIFFLTRSTPKDVIVPDVSGRTVDEAAQLLKDANLKVSVKKEELASDEFDEGQVVKTLPAIGETVRENASITLYVSTGQAKISLADYRGKDYETAQKELLALGFSADQIQRESKTDDEVEVGNIIKQSPAAGKQVDPKTDTIKLTVSSGTETINVPSFIGWTRGNVQDYLEKKGLVLSALEDYSNETAAGLAIGQSIVNQEVEKGTTITVTFSKGRQPEVSSSTTQSTTSSTATSSSSEPQSESFNVNVSVSYRGTTAGEDENIRIEVQDKSHTSWTPVSEFTLKPDATMESRTIALTVDKNETAAVRVYSNDKNIYEGTVSSKTSSIEVK